jgi:DNA-binding response OmpR family regulator
VVECSAREFDLLCLLAGDMEKVWTFAELTEKVWKTSYLGDADMLVSAVKRLRRRLAAVGDGIQVVSVRGVGFRLVAREVPAAKARVNSSSGVLRVLDASV